MSNRHNVSTFKELKNGQLYFTIGLPRSGKSTFAKKWETWDTNRVVVSMDDVRLAISGQGFNVNCEPTVEYVTDKMVRSLLISGYNVLLDDTHTSVRNLQRVFRIDKSAKYFLMSASKDECIERAIERGQENLVGPIRRMWQNLAELLERKDISERRWNWVIRDSVFQMPVTNIERIRNGI